MVHSQQPETISVVRTSSLESISSSTSKISCRFGSGGTSFSVSVAVAVSAPTSRVSVFDPIDRLPGRALSDQQLLSIRAIDQIVQAEICRLGRWTGREPL